MAKLRLQKIIADAGICSRRKAEILLTQRRVVINGQPAKLGDKADPIIDEIIVDKYLLDKKLSRKVILLNKPVGVISTCSDPYGRTTVLSLVPPILRKGLYPVGRLDSNSRGAIILTNNGELTLQLTHPRFSHKKTYHVWIKGLPSRKTIKRWRSGVDLNGKITMRASVELLQSTKTKSLLQIIMKEGRNKQIRRVAELLGHSVIDLQRTAIGELQLKDLKEGSWRHLESKELDLLTNPSRNIY